jgi:hypothetical protein
MIHVAPNRQARRGTRWRDAAAFALGPVPTLLRTNQRCEQATVLTRADNEDDWSSSPGGVICDSLVKCVFNTTVLSLEPTFGSTVFLIPIGLQCDGGSTTQRSITAWYSTDSS